MVDSPTASGACNDTPWEDPRVMSAAMSPHRRLIAVAPIGVLVGHALTPALFDGHGVTAHPLLHSYALAGFAVAAALIIGFIGFVRLVAVKSDAGDAPLRVASLAITQLIAFLLIETSEASWQLGPPLFDRGLWLGGLVQIALAIGAVGLVRMGRKVVKRFLASRSITMMQVGARQLDSSVLATWIGAQTSIRRSGRGPPAILVACPAS
jgi:4-amino-4-deoxy-L-arabinose transferase-like glycosyltransferase